jgi:hypothetical protein
MTECSQETFGFKAHFSRRVEAGFTAGQVSSDGGSLLLRGRGQDQPAEAAGDRLSTEEMKGNQLRLYFSALAYTLMEALRRLGLQATEWAESQVDTIRRKLFKIGAIVRISVRRVLLQLSSAYPWKDRFVQACHALRC